MTTPGQPTGAPGPSGGAPPADVQATPDDPDKLSVEEAWHKLNYGIGRTQPDLVRKGQLLLNTIDRKTGFKS